MTVTGGVRGDRLRSVTSRRREKSSESSTAASTAATRQATTSPSLGAEPSRIPNSKLFAESMIADVQRIFERLSDSRFPMTGGRALSGRFRTRATRQATKPPRQPSSANRAA